MKNILTNESLERIAPSVFAANQWHERTDKYNFVPTIRVVEALRDTGFQPVRATQSNSRIENKRNYTKHMIRFQHADNMAINLGDVIPEIVLINSHDGTSAYKMTLGLYRLACLNGLTVSENTLKTISVRHIGNNDLCRDVIKAANKITKKIKTNKPNKRAN